MIKIDADCSWGALLGLATWTSLYFPVWPELPKTLFSIFNYWAYSRSEQLCPCFCWQNSLLPPKAPLMLGILKKSQQLIKRVECTLNTKTQSEESFPHWPSAETRAEWTKRPSECSRQAVVSSSAKWLKLLEKIWK